MIREILFNFTAHRPCRLIKINDGPYLERYYLGKFLGLTFYLHRFVRGDAERSLHDHPWRWSLAFVLVGHYIEERMIGLTLKDGYPSALTKLICRNRFRPNLLGLRDFHRIVLPVPETWTLFIHTARAKDWGFLDHFNISGQTSGGEGKVLCYHQPFDLSGSQGWHKNALLGHEIGRQPFGGTPCRY